MRATYLVRLLASTNFADRGVGYPAYQVDHHAHQPEDLSKRWRLSFAIDRAVLTYMFTLENMVAAGWLHARDSATGAQRKREFFFGKNWQNGLDELPGPVRNGLTGRPSPKAIVETLVQDFIIGRPRAWLIRPKGHGMEPPFSRMRHPNEAVVEMRTKDTRTFGFFHGPNSFVALTLVHVDFLKKRPNELTKKEQNERYANCAASVLALTKHLQKSEVSLDDVETIVID